MAAKALPRLHPHAEALFPEDGGRGLLATRPLAVLFLVHRLWWGSACTRSLAGRQEAFGLRPVHSSLDLVAITCVLELGPGIGVPGGGVEPRLFLVPQIPYLGLGALRIERSPWDGFFVKDRF